MDVEAIRQKLQRYERQVVDGSGAQHAAVALILRAEPQSAEVLAIHRSERDGDPWSGHMAFPGGRQHPEDRDLYATASRETFEEVGIDLEENGEPLGCLDELCAIGHGRRLDLVISPYVYLLRGPVAPVLDPREVQNALWVPLATLRQPSTKGSYRYEINGLETYHEAFVYEGYVIWGLTYRILQRFLEVVTLEPS
jgi:8-oxo-dGTP pyrophosphatase MutT (NUDIX family)